MVKESKGAQQRRKCFDFRNIGKGAGGFAGTKRREFWP